HSTEMDAENSIRHPNKIVPKTSTLALTANGKTPVIADKLPAMSFKVYKVK
ncbi:MAG: hypothetical protein HUK08_09515, partial [Bacteroidaceae bacterium]|nr:hypothetical protein [Bacteroidaceae bacterium]